MIYVNDMCSELVMLLFSWYQAESSIRRNEQRIPFNHSLQRFGGTSAQVGDLFRPSWP